MHRFLNVFSFLFLLYLSWSFLPNTRAKNELAAKNIVTMGEYEQCKTGMSYSRCVEIIGQRGVEQYQDTIGKLGAEDSIKILVYEWKKDDLSVMSARFRDDQLSQKHQFGLD